VFQSTCPWLNVLEKYFKASNPSSFSTLEDEKSLAEKGHTKGNINPSSLFLSIPEFLIYSLGLFCPTWLSIAYIASESLSPAEPHILGINIPDTVRPTIYALSVLFL
jgi:hypothetical protein